jgi:DNA-binding response OmpR family regulator
VRRIYVSLKEKSENSVKKRQYKILVIDDEPDINSVIKKGLNRNGFEVETFTDPLLALSNFKAGFYDLLLIDIRMPKMNGFELYREIKKIDNQIKVCFITALEFYYDEFRRAFPKLNMNCFARKPISIDEMANIIKEEIGD